MHRIAIVLAGGAGSRLGRDKARAPVAGIALLDRVVTAAEEAGFPVSIVGAGAATPVTSRGARRIADPVNRRMQGPLAGFATGLEAAPPEATIALLLATDHPFLAPGLLRELADRLERSRDFDAVVPCVAGRDHPLVAAYRTSVRTTVLDRLASHDRAMRSLLPAIRVDRPNEEELRRFDPSLRSFLDVDDADDLARAEALARDEGRMPRSDR